MKTVTIQKTGKGIKFFLALFKLGLLCSLIASIVIGPLAIPPALLCLVLLILTKIIRWWCHE